MVAVDSVENETVLRRERLVLWNSVAVRACEARLETAWTLLSGVTRVLV